MGSIWNKVESMFILEYMGGTHFVIAMETYTLVGWHMRNKVQRSRDSLWLGINNEQPQNVITQQPLDKSWACSAMAQYCEIHLLGLISHCMMFTANLH